MLKDVIKCATNVIDTLNSTIEEKDEMIEELEYWYNNYPKKDE
jgi:hypothetical protein